MLDGLGMRWKLGAQELPAESSVVAGYQRAVTRATRFTQYWEFSKHPKPLRYLWTIACRGKSSTNWLHAVWCDGVKDLKCSYLLALTHPRLVLLLGSRIGF